MLKGKGSRGHTITSCLAITIDILLVQLLGLPASLSGGLDCESRALLIPRQIYILVNDLNRRR